MRNDLVEKYQYYMTEAARLQQLVNEQADYIAELEKVLTSLMEDVYDTADDSAAMRRNIRKAPNPKAARDLTNLHAAIKASPKVYGRSMDALGDLKPGETPSRKRLTPMAARSVDGYDTKNTDPRVKLGVINKINKSIEEQSEDDAQDELSAVDRIMADVMPGVKAKNRPMMKPKKPVDLTPEALKLKAQEDLEK